MVLDLLQRVYSSSRHVIARISDDDLSLSTPCEKWDVQTLLNHYVNAIAMFPVMVAGGEPDWFRQIEMPDRVQAFDDAVTANLAGWRSDGALDMESVLPDMLVVDLNLLDAVVHTWDLATALDVDPQLDDESVAFVLERWLKAPLHLSRQYGAFGPEVSVPADAPALERLLGLAGRARV